MALLERGYSSSAKKLSRAPKKRETFLINFLSLTDALCLKYGIQYEVPFLFWTRVHETYKQGRHYNESEHKEIWKAVLSISQELCDAIIYDEKARNSSIGKSYLAMPTLIVKLLKLD